MKSIYSLHVLQRILDHWHVGIIQDVTYFEFPGREIWRHWLETNQGVFNLYSYPAIPDDPYFQQTITAFLDDQHGIQHPEIVHSFDRRHILDQQSRKQLVSAKQIATDLALLKEQHIEKIFRVIGSLIQIEFSNGACLISYGHWNVQQRVRGVSDILLDGNQSHEKVDAFLAEIETKHLKFEKYKLKGSFFELYFTELSFHFTLQGKFPAAEILFPARKNYLKIFNEDYLEYSKDL